MILVLFRLNSVRRDPREVNVDIDIDAGSSSAKGCSVPPAQSIKKVS